MTSPPMSDLLAKSVEIARVTMRGDRKSLQILITEFRTSINDHEAIDTATKDEINRLLTHLLNTAMKSKTTCPARKIATQLVSIFHKHHLQSVT